MVAQQHFYLRDTESKHGTSVPIHLVQLHDYRITTQFSWLAMDSRTTAVCKTQVGTNHDSHEEGWDGDGGDGTGEPCICFWFRITACVCFHSFGIVVLIHCWIPWFIYPVRTKHTYIYIDCHVGINKHCLLGADRRGQDRVTWNWPVGNHRQTPPWHRTVLYDSVLLRLESWSYCPKRHGRWKASVLDARVY